MDEPLKTALILAYGYLLGSVPIAYLIGRAAKGVDLRKVGSGTVGASNLWYNVGKVWIFPAGAFDLFVKGSTPVWLARGPLDLPLEVQVAAGLLAVVGHNWSIFLRFQGGRGVAPTVGVMIALSRVDLVMFIIVATVGWRLTNSAAVWVLIGMALLPVWAVVFDRPPAIDGLFGGLIAITVAKRLASNFKRQGDASIPRLLLNRLLYDRDIREHDAWVRRESTTAE